MKNILSIVLVLFAIAGFAQDASQTGTRVTKLKIFKSSGEENELLSKNGHQILPKKGDWSLGINASSVLQYFGNAANGENLNVSPAFNQVSKGLPNATIWGKYFIADDLAWRGGAHIFANANRTKFRVDDDASTNPDEVVFDIRDIEQFGLTLSLGLEKRKGKSRVQGVYGADVYVHYTTENTSKFQYGNEITATNQTPTGTGFGNPTGVTDPALGFRITEGNLGNNLQFGLRGFVGVEYFFAPKMSLGGEFYWGVSYSTFGDTSVTFEGYEGSQDAVIETSTFTEGDRTFEMGFDNTSAAINLFFYF
ncbi:hypothetical protein [Ekhidna sp.]